jgi:hypothetical protein
MILRRRSPRCAVGLFVKPAHTVGRLRNRLRDLLVRADHVDRGLQDRVGRLRTAAQQQPLGAGQRCDFSDPRAKGAQLLDHRVTASRNRSRHRMTG